MRIKEIIKKIQNQKELFLFWSMIGVCACYWFFKKNAYLDDAFIYFRLACNLLNTGKPEFNIGDNLFVATSPLWLGMLAAVKGIFPFLGLELIAKILWIVLLSLASYFAFLILFPRIKKWACFIGLPLFCTPLISFLMGNEIALLYAALFFTVWACERRNPIYTGFGLGIGYLARGEYILLFVPVILYYIFTARKTGEGGGAVVRDLLKITTVAFAVALPWHIYYFAVFNDLFPGTLQIKMIQGRSSYWSLYHTQIGHYISMLLGNHVYLLPLVIIGAFWQPVLFLFFASYTLLHSIVYTCLRVPDYWWYYYDYYLLVVIFLFLGIFRLFDLTKKHIDKQDLRNIGKWQSPGYYLLLMGFAFWFSNLWMNAFEYNLDLRYENYKAVSQILKKKLQKSDVILTAEVGIVSYFLDTVTIRDTNGIASPDVHPENMNDCVFFVDRYSPRFIILLGTNLKELNFCYHTNQYIYRSLGTICAKNRRGQFSSVVYEFSNEHI